MAQAVTNELIYEVLKKLQGDVTHIRDRIDDYEQQLLAVRDQIHNLEGHVLRIDKQMVLAVQRLDHIERRLELADAE